MLLWLAVADWFSS